MSRARHKAPAVLAAVVVAVLAAPAAATAGVRLKGFNAAAYPTVRATVVASAKSVRPVIREDGHSVVGFAAQNLGNTKAVVLAVDRSRSMAGAPLADASAAARGFLAAKTPTDEVSVVAFGAGAYALSRLSTSPLNADSALQNLSIDAHQGTSLYDAVVTASRQLAAEHLPGRVLILLTDGRDVGSSASLDGALAEARKAGVAVYAIGIEGQGFTRDALVRLARETGGQYYGASSTSALRYVYASIASSLKRTWRVEYVTAARPGDRIHLNAAVVGAGSDDVAVSIPTMGLHVSKPAAPSKLVPANAYGPGGPLAIAVAVGALFFLGAGLLLAAYRGSWVRNRIAAHVGLTKAAATNQRRQRRHAALAALFRATERAFSGFRHWQRIQRMLERAAVPLRAVELFWIAAGTGIGVGLIAAIAGRGSITILIVMALGAAAPFVVVWWKMRRRLRAFEDQLPDILITIAASLKAGHSFKQGLQAVVDEGQPPASEEFKRVLTETSLGRPMDEALAEMAVRAASKNFEFAITAVTIQRQVGGSLATLFDMVADTVRQRQQFARKIRGLTAMGRMSAYTLVAVPFLLAAAITLINREYIAPLYTTNTGHLLIALGLGMMAVGSAFLKKIVSFRG